MKIIIEHIIKFDNSGGWGDILLDIYKDQKIIQKQNQKIMDSQAQLVEKINAAITQLGKIKEESTATLQKVSELQDIINNQGGVSPELQAAVDNLKAQVQVVDDLVPDVMPPVEPPVEGEQPSL